MADLAHPRSAFADIGGHHLHNHKFDYDTSNGVRYSEQRSSPEATPQGSKNHNGGRGSDLAASEEAANEDDDEEDSSSNKEDEQEDDEDDPEVLAPSHGYGKGKGKRPAIRFEPADDEAESQDDEDETSSRGTGLIPTMHPVSKLNGNKKRTFSNVSNTSLLFGDEDGAQSTFPRQKVARTLSHTGGNGLLTYKATNGADESVFENAIESSDEDNGAGDAEQDVDDHDDDDADDEDYSGVNLIPDGDSDIEKMEQEEETFIIHEELHQAPGLFQNIFNDARRPSIDSFGSDVFDFETTNGATLYAPVNMQDIGFGSFFESESLPAAREPISKRKLSEGSSKRVRFDDEVQVSDSASSSSSEEIDSALFPDLFLEQDKIPPSLYQLMETDNDTDNGDFSSSASEHSYWDVGQDETRNLAQLDSDDFDESSDPGSSGYETDMGDTTDEYDSDDEVEAPPRTPRNKSILNRISSAPASRVSSPRPFQRSAIGPTRGIFVHEDSRQAIAVTNRTTKTVTFYRPRLSVSFAQQYFPTYSSGASTANNSPRAPLQQLNASDSELNQDVFTNNPFMNSTDIMLTGIFGSAPANYNGAFGGDSVGPPEAFYPFISIGQNGNVMSDEDEFEDDEDFEDDLNLADFMDFGDDMDATDLEPETETDVPATPATSTIVHLGSTPGQPTPMTETPGNRKRYQTDAMLEHFDRAGVTAFRNNQNRFRDIQCLPPDPNLRASASKPIRSGRSAETLMSPLRKRSSMAKKHGSSPFAGVTKAAGRLQSSVMSGRRGPRMGTFS